MRRHPCQHRIRSGYEWSDDASLTPFSRFVLFALLCETFPRDPDPDFDFDLSDDASLTPFPLFVLFALLCEAFPRDPDFEFGAYCRLSIR